VHLSDVLLDNNPGELWVRFRFIAPKIGATVRRFAVAEPLTPGDRRHALRVGTADSELKIRPWQTARKTPMLQHPGTSLTAVIGNKNSHPKGGKVIARTSKAASVV
jgi:hypothetical protein